MSDTTALTLTEAGRDELLRRVADVTVELLDVVERLQGVLWQADRIRVTVDEVAPAGDDEMTWWFEEESGLQELVRVGRSLHAMAAAFDADCEPGAYDRDQVHWTLEGIRGTVAERRARPTPQRRARPSTAAELARDVDELETTVAAMPDDNPERPRWIDKVALARQMVASVASVEEVLATRPPRYEPPPDPMDDQTDR